MTPAERAVGWITGLGESPASRAWRVAPSPREVLATQMRAALLADAPFHIAFSGGLDSSLLLAIAVDEARRAGYALPIPVTNTYADDKDADETQWQELVLRHLGVEDQWLRVPLDPIDDVVGPHAMQFLRVHGVCWPNAFLVNFRALCAAIPPGSVLMTGDGGDEAFGQRRNIGLAALAARHRPTRPIMVAAVRGLAPRPLRRWDRLRVEAKEPQDYLWVRPPLREQFRHDALEDELREPLRHSRSTAYWAGRRAVTLGQHNLTALAAERDITVRFPLWSTELTEALQREAGMWGWLTRAEIVGRIAGDLLPEAVVQRRTKAVFNTVIFGPSFRELVRRWDGSGVDEDLVDVAALRREWDAEVPHAGTVALAQQIALAMDEG